MNCSIIFRKNNYHEVIYFTNNWNEAISEIENIALDYVTNLGGLEARKITKGCLLTRGFYCKSVLNKYVIYRKEKNGWFINGEEKILVEFELICHRVKNQFNKPHKINKEFSYRIEFDEVLKQLNKEEEVAN